MRTVLCIAVFCCVGLIVPVSARAHLCDDVWRQMGKLVLKPEITDLVVKDTAEFDVYMQHNMDRGIACRVKLVCESPAFDTTVTPTEGFNGINPGQRYVYHVKLTAKPSQRNGRYPLSFRLVGNDTAGKPRELKSVSAEVGGASAPPRRRVQVTAWPDGKAPAIDGNLKKPGWRGSAYFGPFTTGGAEPKSSTSVMARCDSSFLYLGLGCQRTSAGAKTASDSVTFWLANPDRPVRRLSVKLLEDGTVTVEGHPGKNAATISLKDSGVKAATSQADDNWFGELAIPASLLSPWSPQKDQLWLVNVVRECPADPPEVSVWVGSPKSYLENDSFAELLLLP